MAQEPLEPHTAGAAGHIAVAGEDSKATSTVPIWPCLSFPIHKGAFSCPCQGVGSGGKQQLFSRDEQWSCYKIFVWKHLSQCYCPSSSICPHVPTTERYHREAHTCNYLLTGTLSSGPIYRGWDYWAVQAKAPASSPTFVWVAKQTWKATTSTFNPKSEVLMCPSTLFFFSLCNRT